MSKNNRPFTSLTLCMGLGLLAGLSAYQYAWVAKQLKRTNIQQLLAEPQNALYAGLTFSSTRQNDRYTVRHTIENGVERITYTPKQPRFETPILMPVSYTHLRAHETPEPLVCRPLLEKKKTHKTKTT